MWQNRPVATVLPIRSANAFDPSAARAPSPAGAHLAFGDDPSGADVSDG
ncbi:hypothetical protein FHW73_002983 [Luteimonas sp. RC10]|nr:hypothetical protein [Luteimonas sp. RC10]